MAIDTTRVKDLFLAAAELPSASARAEFLTRECAGDSVLRARVDALLSSHDDASSFLQTPAGVFPDPASDVTRTFTTPPASDATEIDRVPVDPDEAIAFLDPPGRPDSLGRIGHYEVLEILGRGGFGIVFRAFDDTLQRVVAVKVLAPQMAATSPARKRFLREARSSAQVRHENVVQVHFVEEQPLPYLVMEFIPGETLQQRLDRTGPIDLGEVLTFGRQVAEGLAAAHAEGLIHRDVKPANVLLEGGPHGRVKLTDFGLARAADDASISQSGVVAGTPMYMSPEQARGEAVDVRSDLFSLGSVLYVICSGRPPFRASGTLAVLKRVVEDDPRPIREIIPEVPEWLCRIIGKLHAKNVADRFQTAREVADVLADCEAQLAAHGTIRDFSRIPGGRPTGRRFGRLRWGAAGVAIALLGVVVALTAFGWGNSYRYAKGRGELRIDVSDPIQSVVLVGPGAQFMTIGQGSVIRPLHPGQYELQFVTHPENEPIEVSYRSSLRDEREQFVIFPIAGRYPLVIERGEEIRISVRMLDGTKQPVPSPKPSGEGFVSIFNGKDLTGWKTHPEQPGGWTVEDGVLVGRSSTAHHLFSERGDYTDFHLRAEAKVNTDGNGGLYFRSPFAFRSYQEKLFPNGYEAQILCSYPRADVQWTGSLYGSAGPTKSPVAPNEWFRLEVIAQGDRLVVKVNGEETATAVDGKYRKGHLALQAMSDALVNRPTVVAFREIEIQELPASPAAVPRTVAEVLPYLVGTWKTELVVVEPKLPPEAAREVGEQTYEYVAGDKFLRSRGMIGGRETVAVCGFDPTTNQFCNWFTMDKGFPSGPAAGVFNAGDRTMEWLERLPNGHSTFVENKYVDANTITTRHYQQDPTNKFVRKLQMTGTRVARPTMPAYRPVDPNRPAEMKVLDRYVGEWHNERTVTNAATPDRPKRESFRVRAGLILGGRCVEEAVTNDTTGGSNYTLAWFDPAAKLYRRWFFSGAGPVTELTGTWDEAAKTLTWNSTDKAVVVREVFTSDDRSEFRHLTRSSDGKIVNDATGVSHRVVMAQAKPAEVKVPTVPFDPKEAANFQAEWAAKVGEKVEFSDKKLGMEFRVIPPGDFQMGAKDDEIKPDIDQARTNMGVGWRLLVRALQAETPRHPVRITRPIAIGKYEVTVGEFGKFVEATKYRTTVEQSGGNAVNAGSLVHGKEYSWKNVGYAQVDRSPVWNVSRDDAVEFCKWLSKETGRKFRLPTEAEWEWACRAGTDARTFWDGKRAADAHAYARGSAKTGRTPQVVGGLRPNAFGLYDTCGNVWEWCNDWFSETYYKSSPFADPPGPPAPDGGPASRHRAMRGGGVDGTHHALTSTARAIGVRPVVGFRVVCELDSDARLPDPELKNPLTAIVEPLRVVVAALARTRDAAAVRQTAGIGDNRELLAAEVTVTEARIKLAEAERNSVAVAELLDELVTHLKSERDLIAILANLGRLRQSDLDQADARLANAKSRRAAAPKP